MVVILTLTNSSVHAEPALVKNEIVVPDPKQDNLAVVNQPIVASAVIEKPATERVFCGSPKQRNWKNSNASNIAIGAGLAAQRGWSGPQFEALKELWSCESSWNHEAKNSSSGACGIAQALPCKKSGDGIYSNGEFIWQPNPERQIRWGLEYIAARYGSPQLALNFHYSHNWY